MDVDIRRHHYFYCRLLDVRTRQRSPGQERLEYRGADDRAGRRRKIQVVNRDLAEIYLKKDAADRYRKDAVDPRFRNMPETGAQLTFNIGSVDTFRQDLDKVTAESGNKVVLVYENRENSWTSILLQMLPWIIIIGGWFFLMSRMSRGAGGGAGGIMNVGKARAQVFDKENSKR